MPDCLLMCNANKLATRQQCPENVYVPVFVKKWRKTWKLCLFFLNLQPIIQNDWALSDVRGCG